MVNPDAQLFGTLSSTLGERHVIGTVGHVLNGTGKTLFVGHNENRVVLTPTYQFERVNGRPMARCRWLIDRTILDEICLFEVPSDITSSLSCEIENLDCHGIVGLTSTSEDDPYANRSPSRIDPDALIHWLDLFLCIRMVLVRDLRKVS